MPIRSQSNGDAFRTVAGQEGSGQIERLDARELLKDLHELRPAIYWIDMLLSAGLGWVAFAMAAAEREWSLEMIGATIVAIFLLSRALSFIHEISHHHHRLSGFERTWNFIVGFPFLMPSFMHASVHFDHHRAATYGTDGDPEYLPFARSILLTSFFWIYGAITPLILGLRFLLLGPVGFIFPRFETWLITNFSATTMNPSYRRQVTAELIQLVRRDSALVLLLWSLPIGLALVGTLPARYFAFWLFVTASVYFIQTFRILSAHAYESVGQPMAKMEQVADSIDVPGGPWTELWAPVGLRYHAIHHSFPSIPYHALPEAYRRLTRAMPATYGGMSRPSLLYCLRALYRRNLHRHEPTPS